jgi:hypothetical protein
MREGLPVGLDYAALRAAGVDLISKAGSGSWTDYNDHDPGVTILEQLCYALTDLAYRAGFDDVDLFLPVAEGQVLNQDRTQSETALFPGPAVLTCEPVTAHDLRTLLYGDIEDVDNAWISASAEAPGVWDIAVQPYDADGGDVYRQNLAGQVRERCLLHRALGDDLGDIRILKPRKVAIRAVIVIDDSQSAKDAAAQILFDLEHSLAQTPQYTSVASLLATGLTYDEIYDGPPLTALVDNRTPDRRPMRLQADDVEGVTRACAGVLSVGDFAVFDANGRQVGPMGLVWGDDEFPAIDVVGTLSFEANGKPGFVITRDGAPQPLELRGVQESLSHLRYKYHQTMLKAKQSASADVYNSLPQGLLRPLQDYVSIREQFPRVYGLGRSGASKAAFALDESAGARELEINQLKDYLLLFEQWLVNHLAGLANLPNLLRVTYSEDERTYFCAPLDEVGGELDARDPVRGQALRALDTLIRQADPVIARRARWLDHMLARFGEAFNDARWRRAYTPVNPTTAETDAEARRLEKNKSEFLTDYRFLGAARGIGGDYRKPASGQECGLARRVKLLSGVEEVWVVEHVLLRPRAAPARPDDPFLAYKISVIAPARLKSGVATPRDFVIAAVERNCPAHIESAGLFLEPKEMNLFASLHGQWRQALPGAAASPSSLGRLDQSAAALRRFLEPRWASGST